MVTVKCTIKTQEDSVGEYEADEVLIESHWNRPELVRLVIDGKVAVVSARDLIAAVKNATNTARY